MNRNDMRNSASADRAQGRSKEVIGKVKSKVGEAICDEELQARGEAQRVEGKTERLKGVIKERIEDATDTLKAGAAAIKDKVAGSRDRSH